jgi:hypothetical protein
VCSGCSAISATHLPDWQTSTFAPEATPSTISRLLYSNELDVLNQGWQSISFLCNEVINNFKAIQGGGFHETGVIR